MRQSFTSQPALFVSAEALDHPALHALDEIEALIDWGRIEALLPQGKGATGRPGYPALTLFRALLLGLWRNLSDGKLEAQLARDLLFRRFCRLEFDRSVPDATVLRRYRGELREGDLLERLLEEINGQLTRAGVMLEQGRIAIVDATVIEASQSGAVHGDEEAGFAHKPNARGTMAKTRGWKAFVNCDREGFIHATALRPGNVYEGHVLSELLPGEARAVYADKAYDSKANAQLLAERGMLSRIQKRGARHIKLTPEDHAWNRMVGKTRAGVEAVFGSPKRLWGLGRSRYLGRERTFAWFRIAAIGWNLWKAGRKRRLCG